MNRLTVLVIDDDPCFMPFLYQNYEASAEFMFATTETEMEECLRQKFDAILMDGSLLGWKRGLDE